ncbi:MAG: type II toxin-antitoxin system HicB family antitoxin [Elusimicrobia bacterium]|nr:type II toxin-antitoxin system HicB family antitoxin [Elusimicrobiota bacterium]
MKVREAIRLIEEDGWFLVQTRGSHRQYKHELIIIEKAEKNFSAFCPDLPGCIATGATKREVERNIREAIALHLEGLKEDGLPVPRHTATAEYVAV